MNPARTLGPAVFSGFESYSWIYFAGPALGSGIAAGLYRLLKAMYVHLVKPPFHSGWNGMSSLSASKLRLVFVFR